MARKNNGSDRSRQLLAQEAARIIVDQGIDDFRLAKIKAAERLGMTGSGSLPGNAEIQAALGDHLQLFGRESYAEMLYALRLTALSAMDLLSPFTPRLVGPVLHGTATLSAAINLHVFADHSEPIADRLNEHRMPYRPYERRLKWRRDCSENYAGFRFALDDSYVEATVFSLNGMRQAPISPIDGKPMQRADSSAVRDLLAE